MKSKKIFILIALLLTTSLVRAEQKRGFAIVIDPKSYQEAGKQVADYAAEIEKSGLKVTILVDRWGVPDSIRYALQEMYNAKKTPIEGAVLMGDIPVPMIRDAQHLTSAFKMDQEVYDPKESSVPSDRYYDDFNLEFNFINRDSDKPEYFYYSLTAASAQKNNPSIYSGRIRPTDCGGTSRYEKLRKYLQKVVSEKQAANELDQVLYFSGNGFISESMTARIDEKATLYEHYPWLKQQENGIGYIDHKQAKYIKFKLMNEMQRNDLDLSILHHHGDWNTQYMNDLPLTNNTRDEISSIKLYLRESLRHAKEKGKNIDSIQVVLAKRFDVPVSWFEGSFDAESIKKDSIHIANLDLYLEDFDAYHPNCRFVILDACFNASFHRDNSIANAYIFNEGKTIAVLANSVNVLQDKWVDRYVGLLGMGMYAGNLVKYNAYLESHLIGDPTFTFRPSVKTIDINTALINGTPATWRKILKDDRYPTLQSMAVEQLFRAGKLSSADLLDIFKTSKSYIVRVQALVNLSQCRDENFIRCLNLAINDSYEMVGRFAMNMLAASGDPKLVPALVSVAISNNTSERIEFSVKQGLALFDGKELLAEFERQYPNTNYMDSETVKKQIRHAIEYNGGRWGKYMEELMDPNTSQKSRLTNIRSMRNYHVHFMIPQLLDYMQKSTDNEVQQKMLEAFGWFRLSHYAPQIAKVAKEMSENPAYNSQVRDEALKTYKRLQ